MNRTSPNYAGITSLLLIVFLISAAAASAGETSSAPVQPRKLDWSAVRATANQVDLLIGEAGERQGRTPARPAPDALLARRATLDLAGRLPTVDELTRLALLPAGERRAWLIETLVEGDEFPWHMARVIDAWVQGRQSGDDAFLTWLRQGLESGRGWDTLLTAMLVGPWDQPEELGASRFLKLRIKNLDSLTADSAQAFFGVDISCARCHDHPLVEHWKQQHYYGLAAFFGRTKEDKAAPGQIADKSEGEVTYVAAGQQATAAPMFLSGATPGTDDRGSRRELLLRLALEERQMVSRAAVNRMWAWCFGRGLVEPVDQMHPANAPSVPGVLERLADDWVAQGYDMRFLVAAIVSTQAYARDSRWSHPQPTLPEAETFLVARLRPLSREQFARCVELALGDGSWAKGSSVAERREAYLAAEKRGAAWLGQLDPPGSPHQSSAAETLFLSNHATLDNLTRPEAGNLAARLLTEPDARRCVKLAFEHLLSREPSAEELRAGESWMTDGLDRSRAVQGLLWALVTSSEFRFNH